MDTMEAAANLMYTWAREIITILGHVIRTELGTLIHCKNCYTLDSFDRGGKVNLSDYFGKPVLVDKKRPLDRRLKPSEFTFTDNCRLDGGSLSVTNNGTINGCGRSPRAWTIKDKCGNAVPHAEDHREAQK